MDFIEDKINYGDEYLWQQAVEFHSNVEISTTDDIQFILTAILFLAFTIGVIASMYLFHTNRKSIGKIARSIFQKKETNSKKSRFGRYKYAVWSIMMGLYMISGILITTVVMAH